MADGLINVLSPLLHSNIILVTMTIIYFAQRLNGLQTDYVGVAISSDLSWLKHITIVKTGLAEALVYLIDPYLPAHNS